MDDTELLESYARTGAQDAFARLVERHVNLVYSSALRQMRDVHLADDVTQAVFLILAQKARAGRIAPNTVLAGWLFSTTRNVAQNARRTAARRIAHENHRMEMEAKRMNDQIKEQEQSSRQWEEISPLLDSALARLKSAERDAVLLRFIEGKSQKAVGDAMGITEDAARKRIDRAIEKLRGFFTSSGVSITAVTLASLLQANTASAAPARLIGLIAYAAAETGAASTLAHTTMTALGWAKAKIAACAVVLISTATVATTVVYKKFNPPALQVAPVMAAPNPQLAADVPKVPAVPAAIEGIVQTPDEQPAVGAEIYLVTPDDRTEMLKFDAAIRAGMNPGPFNFKSRSVNVYAQKWPDETVTADARGHFELPATKEPWVIVVRHNGGFAQVSNEQFKARQGNIQLAQWGRVEGVVRIGSKPLANQTVKFFDSGTQEEWEKAQIRHDTEALTDAEGRFSFDAVAPGDWWLALIDKKNQFEFYRYTLVEVEAGKTLTANIGGTGRPVIGRVAAADSEDPKKTIDWSGRDGTRVSASYSRSDGRGMPATFLPKNYGRMTRAEQLKVQREWEKTPLGKIGKRSQWSEPVLILNADGSFRIDDLEPGKYQIQFRKHKTENAFGVDLVESWQYFTVPEIPGGRSDEPLDIGVVSAKLKPVLSKGEPAPEFTLKSFDGKPVKLSDYRGKYVVLKWWWPWSQLETEAEAIRAAYETIKDDADFVLISIGIDDDLDLSKKRVADHKLPGVHLHCPRTSEQLMRGYLASPSSLCIIGPDGKVIAKNLVTEAAETEVAKVKLEKK